MQQLRESDIEKYLVARVKNAGGEVRKLKWIGRSNAPDRGVFLCGVHFVELKRPGEQATAAQAREHERMRKHGASVYVLTTYTEINFFMAEILK